MNCCLLNRIGQWDSHLMNYVTVDQTRLWFIELQILVSWMRAASVLNQRRCIVGIQQEKTPDQTFNQVEMRHDSWTYHWCRSEKHIYIKPSFYTQDRIKFFCVLRFSGHFFAFIVLSKTECKQTSTAQIKFEKTLMTKEKGKRKCGRQSSRSTLLPQHCQKQPTAWRSIGCFSVSISISQQQQSI